MNKPGYSANTSCIGRVLLYCQGEAFDMTIQVFIMGGVNSTTIIRTKGKAAPAGTAGGLAERGAWTRCRNKFYPLQTYKKKTF